MMSIDHESLGNLSGIQLFDKGSMWNLYRKNVTACKNFVVDYWKFSMGPVNTSVIIVASSKMLPAINLKFAAE